MIDSPDCAFDRVSPDLAIVSTMDFFYPLVDDPYEQGRIGAANVLSDLYAAGVQEIRSGLMVLAVSSQMPKNAQQIVTRMMIDGFASNFAEAGAQVTGGQTVFNDAPIIGGTAIGLARGLNPYTPRNAKPGDILVLTKPLGAQIVVNVNQYMRNNDDRWKKLEQEKFVDREGFTQVYLRAVETMGRLNKFACLTMLENGVTSSTDVTGFGILGHAGNLAGIQHEEVDYVLTAFPTFPGMHQLDGVVRDFKFKTGFAPETSGGLLISLPENRVENFLKTMHDNDEEAWIVGYVEKGSRKARLADNLVIFDS